MCLRLPTPHFRLKCSAWFSDPSYKGDHAEHLFQYMFPIALVFDYQQKGLQLCRPTVTIWHIHYFEDGRKISNEAPKPSIYLKHSATLDGNATLLLFIYWLESDCLS